MKKMLTTPNDITVYFLVVFESNMPTMTSRPLHCFLGLHFIFYFFNFMHVFSKTNEHPSHFLSPSCAPSVAKVKHGKGKMMPCTVESTSTGDRFWSLAFI